jgi:hypothetical protein
VNYAYPVDEATGIVLVQQSKASHFETFLTEPYLKRTYDIRDAQEPFVAYFKTSLFEDKIRKFDDFSKFTQLSPKPPEPAAASGTGEKK